jgi:hypothetical protein
MSNFTFNDNGEEWTIWQFEDKGEKIRLATKNLNTDTYFYIDFSKKSLYKYQDEKTKILSGVFGTDKELFNNILNSPYIRVNDNIDISDLIKIKNFIVNNNAKDITDKINSKKNSIQWWGHFLIGGASMSILIFFIFLISKGFAKYKKKKINEIVPDNSKPNGTERNKELKENKILKESIPEVRENIIKDIGEYLSSNEFNLNNFLTFINDKYRDFNLQKISTDIIDTINNHTDGDLNKKNIKFQICNDESYLNTPKFKEIFGDYCKEYNKQPQQPQSGGFSFKKRSGKKNIFLLFTILLLGVLNITKIIKNFII